jgi:Cof subfamily protein (haloacid dehalogenase superfamily)
VRLLALDIDGTLLGSDKQISPRTRQALAATQERGVHLLLVTGRRPPAARRVADELGPGLPLVLHNGALIVEGGEVIRCLPLAKSLALEAIAIGRATGADPVLHCGLKGQGLLHVSGLAASGTLVAYYLDKSHPDVRIVVNLEASLTEDPIQVMFGGTLRQMEALHARLGKALTGRVRLERTVYPAIDVALIDVLDLAVGKAQAVAFMCARWGIAAERVLAIGDNWNDREMLLAAGRGLVMGNADPGLHQLGLEVLPSNDQDGVAIALERYVLKSKRG